MFLVGRAATQAHTWTRSRNKHFWLCTSVPECVRRAYLSQRAPRQWASGSIGPRWATAGPHSYVYQDPRMRMAADDDGCEDDNSGGAASSSGWAWSNDGWASSSSSWWQRQEWEKEKKDENEEHGGEEGQERQKE